MAVFTICPACNRALRVPDALLGQAVKCPTCLHEFPATSQPTGITAKVEQEPNTPQKAPAPSTETRIQSQPVPMSAERRPRPFEADIDDVDDEWDVLDEQRRLRSTRMAETVRKRVTGPANGLFTAGVLNLIFAGFELIWRYRDAAIIVRNPLAAFVIFQFGLSAMKIAISVWIMIASQKMKRFERYGFVKAATIVSMIPGITPCCFLGLIFGFPALNALNDKNVRTAFERQATVE